MPAHLIAETGPQRGQILNLETGEVWIVGRDPDVSDFVLEDSTVSRKHARLTKTSEGVYLENLSRINPTLMDEERVVGKVLLKEGSKIQIGHSTFLFSEEDVLEKPKNETRYDDIFGKNEEEEPLRPEKGKSSSAYDTIFEDTGEEPPLHFLSETPLMLKVISGPNAGAEISIEKGRAYTLGKDSNTCDIVFQDMSVSRHHARLSVNEEGGVEIEDLGSKNGTAVNGVRIEEKKIITTQDLISMGTTLFLIINRDAPQETIYSPLPPASFETAPKEEPPMEEEEVAAASAPSETSPDWKKQPIPFKHLIGAGALVVSFFIIFLSFFSLFKAKGQEIAHKDSEGSIREIISRYEGVQFTYNPGSGKLFLVGHMLTGIEEQQLQYQLSQLSFITSFENNIVIDELVWKSINDVLYENTPWKGVSIHSMKPGQFILSGFVQTSDQYTGLCDYLAVNFPYMDRLENKAIIADTLTTQLQSLILSKGFGAVTFEIAGPEVILSGRFDEKKEDQLHDLIKKIKSIHGVGFVKNLTTPTSSNMAAIDLTSQFTVTGMADHEGKGYNVLLNGKLIEVSGIVQGFKIIAIEKNTILLEKDGLKYKIDYTK